MVSPDDRRTVQHLVDGQLRPMLAATTQDHLFTVTEPIDVVYTWVDGSDPAWLERKSQASWTPVAGRCTRRPPTAAASSPATS